MADDSLRDELAGFLDDIASDLTRLHVSAAQFQNAPHDQGAVDELARIPGALIERAQNLKARLDADGGETEPKPKATESKDTAKPKAAKR